MRRLRTKMLLLIATPVLAILVVSTTLLLVHLRREAERDLHARMIALAQRQAALFDAAFRERAAVVEATADVVARAGDLDDVAVLDILERNVATDPAVYGAAMAFEPDPSRPDDDLRCPYVHRDAGGTGDLVRMNIGRAQYDWHADPQWEWWHRPKQERHGVWTRPYFDDGAGDALMVTYAAPMRRGDRFLGVTTIDIELSTLHDRVAREIVGDERFTIVTADGTFVYAADPALILRGNILEVVRRVGRPDLLELAERMVAREPGSAVVAPIDDPAFRAQGWDAAQRVFFAPIASTGWVLMARVPDAEVAGPATRRLTLAIAVLAGALVLVVASIGAMARRVTQPLERLQAKVEQIAAGDLTVGAVGLARRDEIGRLGRAFDAMAADLRANLERLADERAARERIERDLDIAREIQHGLLPAVPPRAEGYEVAGWNRPADKTGGDYYDWFELPDGRVLLTLADVTGHGIGPALIVAVCRAYMRAAAGSERGALDRAVARVNDLLGADLPSNRFVTAAIGVLDPQRHEMLFLSAGQAPVLVYRAATGTVECAHADGPPLGVIAPGVFDPARTIAFAPGDALVLTTDGFFEWADPDGEQYGIERLERFVAAHAGAGGSDLIARLHADVLAHVRGTEQADDLTALVVRRLP